jgi:hypothetical protein
MLSVVPDVAIRVLSEAVIGALCRLAVQIDQIELDPATHTSDELCPLEHVGVIKTELSLLNAVGSAGSSHRYMRPPG